MNRIGIFPGTFDPVHAGHVAFARRMLAAGDVDRIVFIPEAEPKEGGVTPVEERLRALEAAIAGTPRLSALRLHAAQFDWPKVLTELQSLYPDTALTLIINPDEVQDPAGTQDWPAEIVTLYYNGNGGDDESVSNRG